MDQIKIWDYFQNDESIGDAFAGAHARYKFLARHISQGMEVLNVGVGRGGLEAILLQKGAVVSCLDPSEKSIEIIRTQLPLGEHAQVGYSQSMPFADCRFDAVIMSEVLEHLNDEVLSSTLGEVSRVLKSGGRFMGTVPADEILLVNQAVCPHCGEPFHRWGHIQSFGRDRLSRMLDSGFNEVRLTRHYFGDVRTLNWKGRIVLIIKKVMIGLGIKGSGETYFFTAHKQ